MVSDTGSKKIKTALISIVLAILTIIAAIVIIMPEVYRSVQNYAQMGATTATTGYATSTFIPVKTPYGPTPPIGVTDEKLAKLNELMTGKEIRTVDIEAYNRITPVMSMFDVCENFGKTLKYGNVLVYLVKEGSTYSLLQIRLPVSMDTPYVNNFFAAYPKLPDVIKLGVLYPEASATNQDFVFPTESAAADLITEGRSIQYLFTEFTLPVVDPPYLSGPGVTINGISGYYKVSPGQKYRTTDDLTASLRTYFSEAKTQECLALKTYVMYDGELYAKYIGAHGGLGDLNSQKLYVSSADKSLAEITVVSLMPGEGSYQVMTTKIRLIDDVWKITE